MDDRTEGVLDKGTQALFDEIDDLLLLVEEVSSASKVPLKSPVQRARDTGAFPGNLLLLQFDARAEHCFKVILYRG